MKKLFVSLLTLVMTISCSIFTTGCVGKLNYELNSNSSGYIVSCGNLMFKKEIEILSEYEGLPVVEIAENGFEGCSSVENITIPNTIKSIGAGAFNNCKNLQNVYFTGTASEWAQINFADVGASPFWKSSENYEVKLFINNEEVTKIDINVNSINANAFAGYSYLTEVKATVNEKIGEQAFSSCTSLKTITINGLIDTIDGYAFYFCNNLESINIPASVKSIAAYAFHVCDSLKSATFEDPTGWSEDGLSDPTVAASVLRNKKALTKK